MRLYRDLTQIGETPSAVALGCFDGLHSGHRQVISGAVEGAREGLIPSVFTFDESPASQVKGPGAPMIMTNSRKLRLLGELGVERIYMPRFAAVRHMGAQEFVEKVLHGVCRAKKVCCGFNFRFGEGGAATSGDLERLCAPLGIRLVVTPAVVIGGAPVSSTRIRRLVEAGEMERAAEMLGRLFGFDFRVAHGRKLGRTLGAPTINQPLPDGFVRPRFGVYASIVSLEGARYSGVTNIGVRPTVGSARILAETWIHGYSGDLYGRAVQVELLRFIRPEKKFSGLDELKSAILRDEETAKAIAAPYLQTPARMI